MGDVRWFASNAYTALVVPALASLGIRAATSGDAPARVAIAMSGLTAEAAWRWARRHGTPLIVYLWDLPPQGTARGRHDPVWWLGGRFLRLPRPGGGYGRRRGYYSRLRYIARRAEAVWVPSGFTRQIVAERFGVAGLEVPYCYDSARFHPGTERPADPPLLLTVSRLKPHKNQALTLRAAARIGGGLQVRLIGRGPDRAPLEALAAALGVRCRVDEEADDAEVVRAYRTARVAVCPSRFEGFGLTPIEALACAVPTVASDIPPHREFVGHAARLVPPDDEAGFAAAIEAALSGPAPDPRLVASLTIPAAAERVAAALVPFLR